MTLDEAIKHANEVAEENQAIVDSCDYYGENMAKCEECAKEHRQLATWLKELKRLKEQISSSDEPNKWIPISKEVPEENGYYLTTTMFNQVYCDYWNGVAFDRSETVIAWMPKPAPYKPQEKDDESCDEIWERAYAERDSKK